MATVGGSAQACSVCVEAPSKYKCPNCRTPYCSVNCYRQHKEICKPASTVPPPPATASSPNNAPLQPPPSSLSAPPITCLPSSSAVQQPELQQSIYDAPHSKRLEELVTQVPLKQPRRVFEENVCDEEILGSRLQLHQLKSLAESEALRSLLKDPSLQRLLLHVDSAIDAEKVLEEHMATNETFKTFASQVLDTLQPIQNV